MAEDQREDSEIASAYYADHDLRAVFTRQNTERRRTSGSTLRRLLTEKQERAMTQSFVKIRAEYDIRNNSDGVVVWAQQQIEAGKEEELAAELVELAKTVVIPKRETEWDDELGH